MSREAVETLMDRWMNESAFRMEMRHDPAGTVQRSGVDLDPDERAALDTIDWSLSDEQLQARASKWA